MSRPSKYPRWADLGIIVEPTEAAKDVGWLTSQKPPAQFFNWDLNLLYQWIVYLDSVASFNFGDGSDGNYAIDGAVAAPSGMSKVGATYALTRDLNIANLTMTGTAILCTNGFRCYVNGTFTANGAGAVIVHNDGTTATNALGGAGASFNSLAGGGAGGAGGTNLLAGTAGGNVVASRGGAGGQGGTGGPGPTGAGVGGTVTAPLASEGSDRHLSTLFQGMQVSAGFSGAPGTAAGAVTSVHGGAGGGGGTGDNASGVGPRGGGGGGGAGSLVFSARRIVLLSDLTIRCKGGDGAAGTNLGMFVGGGGGGGGGRNYTSYGSKELNGHTFTVSAPGGAGGIGGQISPATDGVAGAAGTVVEHDLGVGGDTAASGHEESGVAAMVDVGAGDGVDYLQVTFARPFVDASYKFSFSVYNSDGAVQISCVLINKTATGMRIVPVVPFNGQISWEAEV